jgi:putative hemolysin
LDPGPSTETYLLNWIILNTLSGYAPYLLGILLTLAFSALMSATEVAFFSLTPSEREEIAASRQPEDLRIHRLMRDPGKLLAAILIANNFFNVAAVILSSLVLAQLQDLYGWSDTSKFLLEIGLITFLILLFGEITPKVFASRRQIQTARSLSGFMTTLYRMLYPFTALLTRSTRFISNTPVQETEALSRRDLRHAIDLTSDAESPEEEKDILKGLVNFSSITVRNIFRARVDVRAVEIQTSFPELVESINEFGYSRLPVFEGSLDSIKGILYVKDLLSLLNETGNPSWQHLIRPAFFVPESKKLNDMLEEFKSRRLHIAIVVDEYGGTSGIITLEDVLEEIFGEINDEFDTEAPDWTKISEQEYLFEGRVLLNDLIRAADLPEEIFDEQKGESDSLAGLILEITGVFPVAGRRIEIGSVEFIVESVSPSRIKRVRMLIHPDKENA